MVRNSSLIKFFTTHAIKICIEYAVGKCLVQVNFIINGCSQVY